MLPCRGQRRGELVAQVLRQLAGGWRRQRGHRLHELLDGSVSDGRAVAGADLVWGFKYALKAPPCDVVNDSG
jgi:hypothetical protein